MGRQGVLAASLLILVLMAYICEAALLRRSTAANFLRSGREKRAARCVNGDCSSENSESEEANSDYEQENSKMLFPAGSQVGCSRPLLEVPGRKVQVCSPEAEIVCIKVESEPEAILTRKALRGWM